LAVHIELGDIGHPLLVWRGRAEIALQNIGQFMPWTRRERFFARINARSPIFCIMNRPGFRGGQLV
jgi:hypothetical protein